MVKFASVLIFFVLLFSSYAYAKLETAVVNVCFEKDTKPFSVATKDEELAGKLGFVKFKETEWFVLPFKLYIDRDQTLAYKPKDENCLIINKVSEGVHNISIDFKSVSYTNLEPINTIRKKFKADLLYKELLAVKNGASAEVAITQNQNKVSVYQSVENKPIQKCEQSCQIPIDIPIYFSIKSEDEKVPCPITYQLIVENEMEKEKSCYNKEEIKSKLKQYITDNNLLCKVNVEYSVFKVYGEGCLITYAPDDTGMRIKEPEIKLLPLDKQKIRYYLQINEKEKKLYNFSGDRKGESIIPREGDKIELIEVRDK